MKTMLKRSDIKTAMDLALAGSRRLKLTFNKDAFVDIFYLLAMSKQDVVVMDDWDYMSLWAVASSKRWENVAREVTVSLSVEWDERKEDFFLGRMNERALEKIEVVTAGSPGRSPQ